MSPAFYPDTTNLLLILVKVGSYQLFCLILKSKKKKRGNYYLSDRKPTLENVYMNNLFENIYK